MKKKPNKPKALEQSSLKHCNKCSMVMGSFYDKCPSCGGKVEVVREAKRIKVPFDTFDAICNTPEKRRRLAKAAVRGRYKIIMPKYTIWKLLPDGIKKAYERAAESAVREFFRMFNEEADAAGGESFGDVLVVEHHQVKD